MDATENARIVPPTVPLSFHTVPRLCLFSLAFDGSMAVLGQPSFGLGFEISLAESSKESARYGKVEVFWAGSSVDILTCISHMAFSCLANRDVAHQS